jgi:dihydrofolate synthase/folylpolyglutamate synthase
MTAREYLFSLEQIGIKLGLEQIRLLLLALDCPDLAFLHHRRRHQWQRLGHSDDRAGLARGGPSHGRHLAAPCRHRRARRDRRCAHRRSHVRPVGARVSGVGLAALPPSFFEATTALALEAFRDARVDVAVLEVGLGGRLDATNAVSPVMAVITAIDLDHQQYLGNSIEEIANEKAGIIKPGVSTVMGANPLDARQVVRRVAEAVDPLIYAPTA